MISKKSRKVVAALLIGATVCASGTFAYFNSKVDLGNIIEDTEGNKLNITNGKVEIVGSINGNETIDTGVWSYDVARLSTVDAFTDTKFKGAITTKYTSITDATYETMLALNDAYVTDNLSPDILGVGGITASRTDKAKVGDKVSGAITLARPGDAFVLGTAGDDTNEGLLITNNSNITTKIGITAKNVNVDADSQPQDANSGAKAQLKLLNDAGWKVYIKVTRLSSEGNELAADGKVISAENGNLTSKSAFKELTIEELTDGNTYTLSNVKGGEKVTIKMRVELPLNTGNSKQTLKTNSTALANGFDITKLFDVVATQENNPGWNENGTTDTPITASSAPTNP